MWVKTKIGDNGKGGKAMKEMIKRTAVVSIITSLIFAVLGIVMIANPEAAIEIVAAVLGITVIVIGAEKIISYFVRKGNLDFFNYELIYGIIAILFGILIMTHSNTFASIVRIIIGIWIAYAGLMKINISFKLKSANISAWAVVLILSIISLLAGILVMFSNTSSIVILTAVVMIIYAIADVIDEIIFINNVDKILE